MITVLQEILTELRDIRAHTHRTAEAAAQTRANTGQILNMLQAKDQ